MYSKFKLYLLANYPHSNLKSYAFTSNIEQNVIGYRNLGAFI
jgi:hypothetical protein